MLVWHVAVTAPGSPDPRPRPADVAQGYDGRVQWTMRLETDRCIATVEETLANPTRNESGSIADQPVCQLLEPDRFQRRAAIWAAVIGLAQAVGCGVVTLLLWRWSRLSLPQLAVALDGRFQADELARLHYWLGPTALMVCVLGFVPGLGYLVLGVSIWTGRAQATLAAAVLGLTQVIVLSCLLLAQVAGAMSCGDPVALSGAVVLLGTPLGLLLAATLLWWRAYQRHPTVQQSG